MHTGKTRAQVQIANHTKTAAILIAEDNPDDRLILERAVGRACAGVPMCSVTDGQEVIDYLEGKPPFNDRTVHPMPTLLLLDLQMPRRSGLEALEWIRSRPELAGLAVVILSGSNFKPDIERAYDSGANFYVMKPASSADLAPMLESLAAELTHSSDLLSQSLVAKSQNGPPTVRLI